MGTSVDKPFETYESGAYLANNPSWDEEDSEWKADQVVKILKKNNLVPKSIVEVGCGAGGVLAALHDVLPEVAYYGFDIAPDASQFWEKHASRQIDFSVGDFLKSKTGNFDALLLLDVIEHIPDPFEFLSAVRGRADWYVFHIPLDLSAVSVARESPLLYVRKKVGHIHYYTKGLALSLLYECGYEVFDWSYTGATFSAPQLNWRTKLARIPRKLLYLLNRDLGVRLLGGDTLIVLARAR